MPKLIELTVELNVQRVSCPGVWLCQDGRVSLTIYMLGTSYQTCLLPPIFPLMFKDVFYFRKRFQETCALNNICCLLKDETIYCELVQWCENCRAGECVILAQYLGALNDVLFPPNMCSSDGVDLLMRRSKEFPGILSPKIEIATKVRIDEVFNHQSSPQPQRPPKIKACNCERPDGDPARQKQVCHTPLYHRIRCNKRSSSRSRSRSGGSRSCCSLSMREPELDTSCVCPNFGTKSRVSVCLTPRRRRCREYHVLNAKTPAVDRTWRAVVSGSQSSDDSEYDCDLRSVSEAEKSESIPEIYQQHKLLLESRFIEQSAVLDQKPTAGKKKHAKVKISPCVCEICKRYHELFHANRSKS